MAKTAKTVSDVVIAGGGLAGLTLAYQLKNQSPDLDITIVERNQFPVPEAVAKVGESTVEIGSHYLNSTIGLSDHFEKHQLKKFGIRCFFGSAQSDFCEQDELGASQTFGIPTFQIDRGRLENHLARSVREMGVNLVDGCSTDSVDLSGKFKKLCARHGSSKQSYQGKWLVDAAGRQSLLKNKLNLGKSNSHAGNAVWFRLDREIQIDDWSTSSDWRNRCTPTGNRWLSTNHLMGPGYWVWIIPLASHITSIGIVCDDHAFAQSGMTDFQSTVSWLEQNQPRMAAAMSGADCLDFKILRNYSYDCQQVFSDSGWGISGEAGFFADPLYSPGSDFIAINNTLISRLVVDDKLGKDIRLQSAVYQKVIDSIFQNTLAIYNSTYGGFGDRRMMGLKLLWDYSYYWGVLSLLFYKESIADIRLMQSLSASLNTAQDIHQRMQHLFRQRACARKILPAQGVFLDQYKVPCLQYFNTQLKQSDRVDIAQQLPIHVDMLSRIAAHIESLLNSDSPPPFSNDEQDLLGDYRYPVLA
ncbi:MAG: tryptophan 7-halogenase [Acidiferrobacterales bacterium]|nr:tryptophan 7-halogenase [Acidiferrobacterales bacterium]